MNACAPTQQPASAGESKASIKSIYPQIFDAILEQRLAPGTPLTEEALAQIFGVSRTIIRGVLARLSHQQVILQRPNHKAQVAAPDSEQTAQILYARRLAETTLISLAAQRAKPAHIRQLRELIANEREHHEQGQRCAAIRLGGEFHLQLANLAGNAPLAHFLNGLLPLTSLIIAQYEEHPCSHCAWQEHAAIVDAIEGHDAQSALHLMHQHLDRIEAKLVTRRVAVAGDVLKIFSA
ncbi:GntR family transcriptional regulator [Pseudomonas sp. LS1212]|uniref:GntR family transcriptional regulator n=1 Tax=Pseudomonas sp. LS1212 TaxID=2972478 RepID=UPI00215BDD29|nr:GntR family transcriptional regulator [Pseudomonas sp. LS1212]UVJ45588.1 GntR family transcriptional regulator [Pseudomonas sp. LS1212]